MSPSFHPSELSGADAVQPTTAELADSLLVARELESQLAANDVHPSSGFADRVMAAVAAQPLPQPATAAGLALRRGRLGAMLTALADNWRITFSGHHPLAVRAQAMAFVLVAILAVGSLGGVAAIGAVRLLEPAPSVPGPVPSQPLPLSRPTPSPSIEPTDNPEATPSEAGPQPTETDDSGKTPGSTHKPRPSETPEPNETEDPGSGSDHGGGGGGPGSGGHGGGADDGGGD